MIDDDKEGKWFVPLNSQREGSSLVKRPHPCRKEGQMASVFLKTQRLCFIAFFQGPNNTNEMITSVD